MAQQEGTVAGRVTDGETGAQLTGATILVKPSGRTTVTNRDGDFSVLAGARDTLVITYVSYERAEIPVMGREQIDVNLLRASDALEEVVVVGYGTQKHSETTASVSTLNTSDVKKTHHRRI